MSRLKPFILVLFCAMVAVNLPAAADDRTKCLKESDDAAMAACNRQITKNPRDFEVIMGLGNILRGRHLYVDCARTYTKGIATIAKPEKSNWLIFYFRGICYERSKNFAAAEADLKKALELFPDQPHVLNYLAFVWIDRGINLRESLQMIRKAFVQRPHDGYIIDSLGWAHYRLGNFETAVKHLEKAARLISDDAEIAVHFGDALWKVGRHQDAKKAWEHARKFLHGKPTHEVEQRTLAQKLKLAFSDALPDAASSTPTTKIDNLSGDEETCFDPYHPDVLNACTRLITSGKLGGVALANVFKRRGITYQYKENYDRAISDLNEAFKLNPDPNIYSSRGYVFKLKGDFNSAIVDYRASIKAFPNSCCSDQYFLAETLYLKGDYDAAINEWTNLIQRSGMSKQYYKNRADAYYRKGLIDAALSDLTSGIALSDPIVYGADGKKQERSGNESINVELRISRALIYSFGLAQADKALTDLDEAIKILDRDADWSFGDEAFNLRGFIHKQRGQLDKALTDFDEAIRRSQKTNSSAFSSRADIYRLKGDIDGAIADSTEALRLYPDHVPAYVTRGLAYEKKGKSDLAIADFRAGLAGSAHRFRTGASAHRTARERLAALTGVSISTPSEQIHRVALVIGNSNYSSVAKLPNPMRDADAVGNTFRTIGFRTVVIKPNLSRNDFIASLRQFETEVAKADWAVVYYAGHGIEVGGINYLIPVDAKLHTDKDVEDEAVSLDRVLSALESAKKLRLVILDACRENPFLPKMRRTLAARSIGLGLARVEPEGGTLIVYAAKHGQIALDGDEGRNSPFVSALLRRLTVPNLEINKLFRLVRDDVLASTKKMQEPFAYGSLPGEDFFFVKN